MKLTRKQKGLLKCLVHNVVQSEEWEFAINKTIEEQTKSLKIDFKLEPIIMELKIDILEEKNSKRSIWSGLLT